MVFNAIFNNISVTSISWWSVLLVEETGENTVLPQITDKLYHIFFYRVHLVWSGFELATLVVIDIDCIGSCKPIYHTATGPYHIGLFKETKNCAGKIIE
jgi:hypothetical protein